MTEAEWLACADPELMLDHLRVRTTDRKMRLFALACLPVVADRLLDPESVAAVRALADFADGKATADDLHHARGRAVAAVDALLDDPSEQRWHYVAVSSADAAALALGPNAADSIAGVAGRCLDALAIAAPAGEEAEVRSHECRRQVRLIRDIFGNPFRPVTFDPSWRTSTVLALAEGVYEERAFDRLPILADALQDAGCDNTVVLDHCRGKGPHVRGCWVVDRILGRE